MANKRWDWFDKKAKLEMAKPWVWNHARIADLLRGQHRAMVRLVKKLPSFNCWDIKDQSEYSVVRVDDILAALAKQKGGR